MREGEAEGEVVQCYVELLEVYLSILFHISLSIFPWQVLTPHTANYTLFVPSSIRQHPNVILTLLDVTCGRDDVMPDPEEILCPREGASILSPPASADLLHKSCVVSLPCVTGYLLLINTGDKTVKWDGDTIDLEPKTETTISLSHIVVRIVRLFNLWSICH